jgi:Putative MetA-pathway of phenol degradation
MRRVFLFHVLVTTAWLQAGALASAQQRPLTTQDPEVIGDGRLLVETGVETGSNVWYPLSGLRGDRFAVPVGLCLGLGRYAELQLDTGYDWLGIESREDAPLAFRVPADITRTSDIIDVNVATKVRVLAEGHHRPSIGVRFETRLPNASNESGLGLDTTDFYFTILAGKTIGSFRIVGNAAIGILGNPLIATIQSDAFRGGLSVAHAVTPAVDVVGEINGQKVFFAKVPPPGAEPLGEVRTGVRYTRGQLRFDGGVLFGFTERSPDFGVMAGVTVAKQAFK